MGASVAKTAIYVGVGLLILGLMIRVSAEPFLDGWAAMVTSGNASLFTGFATVASSGPTLIILGVVISVAITGFLGLKLFGGKG